MSKIVKKMKIMQPGGTLSDYVPIGAEAENINVDGESVETKLGKKPYYYNTVADMKADTKLKAGDMAVTLGYYSVNDGGTAEYKITSTESQTDYQEELNNSLYATLIIKDDIIDIKQIGIKENESASTKFQNILSIYNKIVIPEGNYILDTIAIPSDTQIINRGKIVTTLNSYIFSLENVSNIIIDGGEYEGQNTNNGQTLIRVSSSSNCVLKNMILSKALNKCISIGGTSTNNLVENVRVSGATSSTGVGVSLLGTNVQYNTIKNVYSTNNRIGVSLNGASYNIIKDIKSYNDSLMGFTIDGIESGTGDGGKYNNCSDIVVIGIQTSGYGGIYLGNGSAYNNFNNIEVKDSTVSPGIKQTNSNGNGNNFTNVVVKNTAAGIVFSNVHYNTLTNFYVEPASGRGIYIAGADHCVFSNGSVYGAGQGILVQAGYCTLSNLKIHNNDTGIQLAFGLTAPNGNIINNIDFANNTTADFVSAGTYSIDNCTGYVVSNFKNEPRSDSENIVHGLSATPKIVIVTPSVAGHMACVTSKNETSFQLGLYDEDGNAVTTDETIYWWAHI